MVKIDHVDIPNPEFGCMSSPWSPFPVFSVYSLYDSKISTNSAFLLSRDFSLFKDTISWRRNDSKSPSLLLARNYLKWRISIAKDKSWCILFLGYILYHLRSLIIIQAEERLFRSEWMAHQILQCISQGSWSKPFQCGKYLSW